MPRADQPIRQWTILKLLESNGRVTLRQIADALSETCHERTLRGAGGGDRAGATETMVENEAWKVAGKYQKGARAKSLSQGCKGCGVASV